MAVLAFDLTFCIGLNKTVNSKMLKLYQIRVATVGSRGTRGMDSMPGENSLNKMKTSRDNFCYFFFKYLS